MNTQAWLNTAWLSANADLIADLAWRHLQIALPVLLAVGLLAIPIGYLAHKAGLNSRWKPARTGIIMASGILYGIPSLALFVVLPVILGTSILSPLNVIIALILYGLALQVRVVAEAFDGIDAAPNLAAQAVGYAPAQLFWSVQLPMAAPAIITGMRVVTASTISLISVGALIGVSSLGDLITSGFQRSFPTQILAGIVGIVVLAAVLDALWILLARLLLPWKRVANV
ncbi:ABC transporter permease [Corynebacterium auriscanis]|uniref:ABC transporter permease n=1 Tax=Corynebacterium auriscanis TaxID=99807 RepID=UPI003CF87C10